MPKSKRLWLMAAHKETDVKVKSKILKRALEHLPGEVDIWKECIELEEPEEAKSLLQKAVQCVPRSTELWLALAKLENYDKARAVLNRAREANPTDYTIYIAAAKLEEAQANIGLV